MKQIKRLTAKPTAAPLRRLTAAIGAPNSTLITAAAGSEAFDSSSTYHLNEFAPFIRMCFITYYSSAPFISSGFG